MNYDFFRLKQEFNKIKNLGLVKAMRKGTSGLGYTFETLLNKAEDQECKPDFGSIEIKCKFGYTKTPLTLFTASPYRNGKYATRYILEKYGYHRNNNSSDIIYFCRAIFSNYTRKVNNYEFKLKVDYLDMRVNIEAYYCGIFKEIVCYWDFKLLETKLKKKLSYLAIIYGYPYTYNSVVYYKYFKMETYKLKGFFEFLNMIANDKIHVLIYIKEGKSILGNPQMDIHGVAFKIKKEDISQLFTKINI